MEVEERAQAVIKRILEGVKGQGRVKLVRRHVERFLYTFANEVGCDFPSDETVKIINGLLAEEGGEVTGERFQKLIEICLNIQRESFRIPIGGIFERVAMGVKHSIYADKIDSVFHSLI